MTENLVKCYKCGFRSYNYLGITCPQCGSLLSIDHGFKWVIKWDKQGIWKFEEMLPMVKNKLSLGEAWTPLIESGNLFKDTKIFFKDEGRNPTGSFRDRAASLIVSDAYSKRAKRIILGSDGNMGASVSAYAAKARIPVTVYVPSWTDHEKILLMKAYGAQVVVKDNSLDELIDYVSRRSMKTGFYNATSTHNILSIEGLKTLSIELYIQLGRPPESVVLPLGSGLTLLSMYHGFVELEEHGLIDKLPKFIGVETCGNPLYSEIIGHSRKCNEKPLPGLSYKNPPFKEYVVKIIEAHGETVIVNRKEVIDAAKELARKEGLFVEPSSAVALAGGKNISLRDYSVIILTGHGLKGPSLYVEAAKTRATVFPGSTKSLILDILKNHPGLTGYEIWKNLGIKISVQAIYQHLHDLERMGLLRSEIQESVRRYYPIKKS